MLKARVLLGTVFVVAVVALLFVDDYLLSEYAIPFAPACCGLTLLVTAMGLYELTTLLRRRGWRIYELPTLAVIILMMAAEVLTYGAGRTMQARIGEAPIHPTFLLLSLLLITVLGAEVVRAVRTGETAVSIESVAGTMFAALYIGLLTVFIVGVRFLPSGLWGFLTWLAVAKCSDIGGYAVGMAIGRHKLTPRLSPGKTVEGLFGSIVLSVGVSLGMGTALLGLEVWQALVFGLVICGTAVVGDLAESLVKRATDSKDSSRMIPGFGGILDIMDSILFTAPAAFVLLVVFVGPR